MTNSSEIFRFMFIRPPELKDDKDGSTNINLDDTDDSTGLKDKLKENSESEQKESDIRKSVEEFKKSNDYIDNKEIIVTPILDFYEWIFKNQPNDRNTLISKIKEIFGVSSIEEFKSNSELTTDCKRISDSLIASYLISEKEKKNIQFLANAFRTCQLIRISLSDDTKFKDWEEIKKFLSNKLIFPKILPPTMPSERQPAHKDVYDKKKKAKERLNKIDKNISYLEAALNEISNLEAEDFIAAKPAPTSSIGKTKVYDGFLQKTFRFLGLSPNNESIPTKKQIDNDNMEEPDELWKLSDTGKSKFSDTTKDTFKELKLNINNDSVFKLTKEAEKAITSKSKARIDESEYVSAKKRRRYGTITIVHTEESDDFEPAVSQKPSDSPESHAPSVQPVGVADLLQVRESLLRYMDGEVAHIENIIKDEEKVRSHRRLDRTEEANYFESEESEENTRELETTERFELQRESSKVLEQDMNLEAGVSVTASYGPTVSVTADVGFSMSRSKSETQRTASNYARSVTERASSNIQKRTLEKHTKTTIREIEETNTHTLTATGNNMSAIYQWVDKLYNAEIINYGSRLLFDFVVPEPGAYIDFVQSESSAEGVEIEEPNPPTHKNKHRKFVPLAPKHITPGNYQKWLTQYYVKGVTPPPPLLKIASYAHKSETSQTWHIRSVDRVAEKITIPQGYYPFKSHVRCSIYPSSAVTGHAHVVLGQGTVIKRTYFNDNVPSWTFSKYIDHPSIEQHQFEDGLPISIFLSQGMGGSVIAEIMCKRSAEELSKWQIETYNQIVEAYQELKSQYDDAISAQRIAQGVAISGRNPGQNRDLEKTELKKASITILRGSHPHFNGVEESEGYPRINLGNYRGQGEIIQFFEHAFEWTQMTFVLYPYFWARNELWPMLQQLDDVDPLHATFLKAGAARVVVPVRPGFEAPVMHYLENPNIHENNRLWNGATESPDVTSEYYLPIWQEIKSLQSGIEGKSEGKLSVTKDSINVDGVGTNFVEDDVDREIVIERESYRVAKIVSPTNLELASTYSGENSNSARYVIGGKFVGSPWEVKVPTSLVYLKNDSKLPDWTV